MVLFDIPFSGSSLRGVLLVHQKVRARERNGFSAKEATITTWMKEFHLLFSRFRKLVQSDVLGRPFLERMEG